MADATWLIKAYDLSGNLLASSDGDNEAVPRLGCFNRTLTFKLNDFDSFSFSMWLDDPTTVMVVPLETTMKVWRSIPGYTPDPNNPTFAGVIAPWDRSTQNGAVNFQAFSPLWRLQHRFYLNHHRFIWKANGALAYGDPTRADRPPVAWKDQDEGGWNPSWICWIMIDKTNEVLTSTELDKTGILLGDLEEYLSQPVPDRAWIRRKYARGQNTWGLIQDMAGRFFDVWPRYIHQEGSQRLMRFDTKAARGVESDAHLCYGDVDGATWNLEDMTESNITDPGSFANYVVAQGQGDKSTDRAVEKADGTTRVIPYTGGDERVWPDLIDQLGLYMYWEKRDHTRRRKDLSAWAQKKLARVMNPPQLLNPTIMHDCPLWFYPRTKLDDDTVGDYSLGDTILLSCNKGSMQLDGVRKRVLEAQLKMSDNNMEQTVLTLGDDYDGVIN